MKNLIILGAGNIAKIAYEYALLSKEYNIKGYLEFKDKNIVADIAYPEVIGDIETYEIETNDVFICAHALVSDRKRAAEIILNKGGVFVNIIHPTANISNTNTLGVGNIIGAFTTLSVNTKIGNHVIIQDHCNIGHDTIIGDYTHIYVGNIICGINKISEEVTIYTASMIHPKIRVEKSSTVGAASVVMRAVKENTTVMGNPAKKIE